MEHSVQTAMVATAAGLCSGSHHRGGQPAMHKMWRHKVQTSRCHTCMCLPGPQPPLCVARTPGQPEGGVDRPNHAGDSALVDDTVRLLNATLGLGPARGSRAQRSTGQGRVPGMCRGSGTGPSTQSSHAAQEAGGTGDKVVVPTHVTCGRAEPPFHDPPCSPHPVGRRPVVIRAGEGISRWWCGWCAALAPPPSTGHKPSVHTTAGLEAPQQPCTS